MVKGKKIYDLYVRFGSKKQQNENWLMQTISTINTLCVYNLILLLWFKLYWRCGSIASTK